MVEMEKVVRFLEENGVKLPQKFHSPETLKKYLEAQKAVLSISIMRLKFKLEDRRRRQEVIMKAIQFLGGDEE